MMKRPEMNMSVRIFRAQMFALKCEVCSMEGRKKEKTKGHSFFSASIAVSGQHSLKFVFSLLIPLYIVEN